MAHRDEYLELVEEGGKLTQRHGNESGIIRSSYWPERVGLNPWENNEEPYRRGGKEEEHKAGKIDIEVHKISGSKKTQIGTHTERPRERA